METCTVGGATSGNCDLGRVRTPRAPVNKSKIETTIANAGRCRIFVNMALESSR